VRVFVAGATGVIGRRLLPRLQEEGHEVTAMTRSEDRAGALREAGAVPVVCDATPIAPPPHPPTAAGSVRQPHRA